jgi:hypothetical protein
VSKSNVHGAHLICALVLVGACSGSANLADVPLPCEGGSVDANVVDSGAEAPVADAARDATFASDAPAGDALTSDAPSTDASSSDAASSADAPQDDAPSTCGDQVKDGSETDLDCGGSCPPCGIGQACLVSGDCGTSSGCSPTAGCACDALSMTCVFDHCFDHEKDGDETDVDCGGGLGGCTGCAVGGACQVDGDCASRACDPTSSSCAQTQCVDHRQDGLETGVDCGGGICPACAVGQGCSVDSDCTTAACDLVSFVCVQDPCADHRQDGTETGDDCGGSVCVPRCQPGQGCNSNYDCVPGHFCNSSKVCQ